MLTGKTLLDGWVGQLREAGIVPHNTRRVIIDIAVNDVVKVYYECYGDEQMFTAELAVALERAEVVHVDAKDDGKVTWMDEHGNSETVKRGSPGDIALQARRERLQAAERDAEVDE